MTIFGDKLLGSILPTRDGTAQGHGAERVMMNAVGGPGGIRTRIVSNPDGTTTMLRTRNGMPEFSTSGQAVSPVEPEYERGFVARVQTKAFGALFSPYTLAVRNPNYRLVNVTYTVLPFASTHNVAYTDTTHWHDVMTFQGNTIRVNGKKMPALVMGGFAPGAKAIPWLIPLAPPYTGLARYGDKSLNAAVKRVFSVRRDEVKSFGGGGVVETLTPTTPRTAGKALTVGPRIDPTTNKAYLGQLFFSGDSWDDMGSEWGFSGAEVAMLLTAPYLTKVSSGMSATCPLASFGSPVSSSGTATRAATFPPTPFGVSAHGVAPGASLPTYFSFEVDYIYSGTVSEGFAGTVSGPYVRDTYSGTSSRSDTCAGYALEYAGNNSVSYDVRDEHSHYNDGTYYYPEGARLSLREDTVFYDYLTGVVSWQYAPMGAIPPYRGSASIDVYGGDIPGSFVTARNYQSQTGAFSVMLDTDYLIKVDFSRSESHGNKASVNPNLTHYDEYMGEKSNPHGGDGTGWNVSGYVLVHAGLSNWDWDYDFGVPNAALDEMISGYAAQTFFTDETHSGLHRTNYYTATQSYVVEDDKVLTWSTKDYLLYDAENGVFISVEGTFVGANTSATLTVLLRVKTRAHDVTTTLSVSTYSGDILPEVLIDTGRYAIPSPQIRAIFAPLYQEQGSFKGAHYVTLAEEANGATQYHGFNFALRLKMYGDLATLNQQNDVNTEIGFIPCNLLEMLYAFVFSQAYGVAETGERYPVWYPARFTALRDGLFTNPIRVNIRSGVNADWLDTLGAPYVDDTTTELYRT